MINVHISIGTRKAIVLISLIRSAGCSLAINVYNVNICMYICMLAASKWLNIIKEIYCEYIKASSSSKVYPSQTNTARGYDDARIMKVQDLCCANIL